MVANNGDSDGYAYLEIPGRPELTLIITPELHVLIKHSECSNLARTMGENDRYYCLRCEFRGRISDIWPPVEGAIATPAVEQTQEAFPF